MKPKTKIVNPPRIYNINKPVNISSHDVVRKCKKKFAFEYGKIGHFGTLDPFADGVLMIGTNGAMRLNEYIHAHLPKTYRAYGLLGAYTDTGDNTSPVLKSDQSEYFQNIISSFSPSFIEEQLQEKFLGVYWQAPHKYSAAKYEGKKLHLWTKEGIEIKKPKKERFIYQIKVHEYQFPSLVVDVQVSSGTYIRSLFQEFSEHLGTFGMLKKLTRLAVGDILVKNAKYMEEVGREDAMDPRTVLKFPEFVLDPIEAQDFTLGRDLLARFKLSEFFWALDQELNLLGLAVKVDHNRFRAKINFCS